MKALLCQMLDWTAGSFMPDERWRTEIDSLLQLPWPADGNPHPGDSDMPAWARACAVFFSARAIEMAAQAQTRAVFQALPVPSSDRAWRADRPDLDRCIGTLEASGRLDSLAAAALHAVRRAGNFVRHEGGYPTIGVTRFCIVMLVIALSRVAGTERALKGWQSATPSDALDGDVRAFEAVIAEPTTRSMQALQRAMPTLLEVWATDAPPVVAGDSLLLWAIERCLDAGRNDLAGLLIAPWVCTDFRRPALALWTPDDKYRVASINRLAALRFSRMGDPASAIDFLTPCAKTADYLPSDWPTLPADGELSRSKFNSYACAETLGILAGAHKRMWSQALGDVKGASTADHHLRAAAVLYAAVHRAQPWNHYIAINCAATAAWCGDRAAAVRTAKHALGILQPIRAASRSLSSANAWADLTFAEALLLAGDEEAACAAYEAAWQAHSVRHAGACASARGQLRVHLDLGIPIALESARLLSVGARLRVA